MGFIDGPNSISLSTFTINRSQTIRLEKKSQETIYINNASPSSIFLSIDQKIDLTNNMFVQLSNGMIQVYDIPRQSPTILSNPKIIDLVYMNPGNECKAIMMVTPSKAFLLDQYNRLYYIYLTYTYSSTSTIKPYILFTDTISIQPIIYAGKKYIISLQKGSKDKLIIIDPLLSKIKRDIHINTINHQGYELIDDIDPCNSTPDGDKIIIVYESKKHYNKNTEIITIDMNNVMKNI
jgi:hypothetical protein